MAQFIKLYSEFSKSGLKPNEMIVLANLYDRMDLSYKNEGFYDSKQHAYYITFTREDLASKVNVGIATITRVFKTLSKKGWIIIKKRFNSSNRIFLPISLKSKNDSPKVSNLDSNQTELKQTNKTYKTNVTSKSYENSQKVEQKENKKVKLNEFDRMQNLVNSLKGKAGFNQDLIDILVKYSENTEALYNYAKLIFKAKKSTIQKMIKEDKSVAREVLIFEDNTNLGKGLAKKMRELIIATQYSKRIKNASGYITKGLYSFFEELVNGYDSYMTVNRKESRVNKINDRIKGFKIPIMKLD